MKTVEKILVVIALELFYIILIMMFTPQAHGQPYGQERYFVNSNDAPTRSDVFYGPSVRQPYLENRTLWDYDNASQTNKNFSDRSKDQNEANSKLQEIERPDGSWQPRSPFQSR